VTKYYFEKNSLVAEKNRAGEKDIPIGIAVTVLYYYILGFLNWRLKLAEPHVGAPHVADDCDFQTIVISPINDHEMTPGLP